jgi:hypothetical protein
MGDKVVIVMFDDAHREYLIVGPLKTEAACEREMERLRGVYAMDRIKAMHWIDMRPVGSVK